MREVDRVENNGKKKVSARRLHPRKCQIPDGNCDRIPEWSVDIEGTHYDLCAMHYHLFIELDKALDVHVVREVGFAPVPLPHSDSWMASDRYANFVEPDVARQKEKEQAKQTEQIYFNLEVSARSVELEYAMLKGSQPENVGTFKDEYGQVFDTWKQCYCLLSGRLYKIIDDHGKTLKFFGPRV